MDHDPNELRPNELRPNELRPNELRPNELWEAARQRRLSTPLLLFAAGHAPLAFLAGQALYVVAPLADLLGWSVPRTWAAHLSRPHALPAPWDADTP